MQLRKEWSQSTKRGTDIHELLHSILTEEEEVPTELYNQENKYLYRLVMELLSTLDASNHTIVASELLVSKFDS